MKLFFFSELEETTDNIPQKANVNLSEDLTEFEDKKISLIRFMLIKMGMMLLVLTDGRPKKCRTEE